MEKRIDKKVLSWALYDFGNSAFSTTVMAGFFPIFFKSFWSHGTEAVVSTARLGSAISISSLIIALVSPTLGVVADLKGFKKTFCLLFTLIGAGACAVLGFIPLGDWWSAILAYGIATMAFNAGTVFYESLLPFVTKERNLDYVSSLGYAMGYLGGGILFLINVLMHLFPAAFGLKDGVVAVQVSFVTVAVWWVLFSFPLARNVPEPAVQMNKDNAWKLTVRSLQTLKGTLKELVHEKNLLLFIIAYWLYIDGVYTVMAMAVDFGLAIDLQSKDLIVALLITQFIGFPCAYYFGTVTKRWGARKPILFCILIYSVSVILATQMSQAWHFFALAIMIGMVQGGVQSLSRSMFAKMIPPAMSGEYFGLFNLVGRFAAILGPSLVGFGALLTGSSRMGMLGLIALFICGGTLLWKVKEPVRT
ncbi:MFS transporter [Bdellovibrio sp. HCB2-146]|uniref:MFS transporter n=1 Tax=Bdellovibrio sp. HCB2-146 TaxID=3394362 RepID=UPI0039BC8E02